MLALILTTLTGLTSAQQVGTQQTETHPRLSWQKCSSDGTCATVNGGVTIDANWRWLHAVDSTSNCYNGNEWTDECNSETDCATKCAFEGADYAGTYGITTSDDALTLKFVTHGPYSTNVGSRLYLMSDESTYQTFTLANNELAFDVDLSTVDCGLNAALYFVSMPEDGGMSSEPNNKAGAKYGTGYCDAQCARDLKFVGGKANIEGWAPSPNNPNAGVGPYGACCPEIDIWESNSHSFTSTLHPCENTAYHVCETSGCGGIYSDDRFAGDCDANGCDYNPYRMGNELFYGNGKTVDTWQKFTVVTRFQSNAISKFLVQNGRNISIPGPIYSGLPTESTLTPTYCEAQFRVLGDRDRFDEVGGFATMNRIIDQPMVLVMSLWDDHYANMLWLDSSYPTDKAGQPGADRGDCSVISGVPADVESSMPNANVVWSNIRFGPIGSTIQV
ncbi:putative cellulose 1, 4-beta-cellobiosidase [Xylaria nigripes]|nr:putative cellulose 1, 4-beta-cellobiosidase [Xylaria nigripes]